MNHPMKKLLTLTGVLLLLLALAAPAYAAAPEEGQNTAQEETDSYRMDPKIEEILRYITANLDADLTVSALAGRYEGAFPFGSNRAAAWGPGDAL